jgi:hypothetical protein
MGCFPRYCFFYGSFNIIGSLANNQTHLLFTFQSLVLICECTGHHSKTVDKAHAVKCFYCRETQGNLNLSQHSAKIQSAHSYREILEFVFSTELLLVLRRPKYVLFNYSRS